MNPALVWLVAHLAAVAFVVHVVFEPGPMSVAVLARRYGIAPFIGAPLWAAWAVSGVIDLRSTLIATGLLVGVLGGLCCLAGCGIAGIWRALRRVVLRARWTSAARACRLCVTEKRPVGIGGTDTSTRDTAVELEHSPAIWRGRALPGGVGVSYRLAPARGSSIDAIAQQAEQLAAALHVARIVVHRTAPDRGVLEAIWRLP